MIATAPAAGAACAVAHRMPWRSAPQRVVGRARLGGARGGGLKAHRVHGLRHAHHVVLHSRCRCATRAPQTHSAATIEGAADLGAV
jgi:hypothetical protein